MRIGIVRTLGSPCRCGEAAAAALAALGHEAVLWDSADVPRLAAAIARSCDLVLDHTDTFLGRGLPRSLVRGLLAAHGARIAGAGPAACLLADDKAAARSRLARAGVPVPPGIVLADPAAPLPSWLRPPLVMKSANEHMSRGLAVVREAAELLPRAAELLARTAGPVLVEPLLPGRDLAACLVAGPDGPEVLPLVEHRPPPGEEVLTAAAKLEEPRPGGREVGPAGLPPESAREIALLARHAFAVLGLREYGRFDLRLTPAGTPFFLEANATPSLEPGEALAVAGRLAGLAMPDLLGRIATAAMTRYVGQEEEGAASIVAELGDGPLALAVPAGVHVPPASSLALARLLDVAPGDSFLDLGCGSGLLALTAARAGAGRVVAVDLDPAALEATAAAAARHGAAVELRAGSWFEALAPGERFDVIAATPPQTPAPAPIGPRWGGAEGTRHLLRIVAGAPRHLTPGRGRLWLLAISLADPGAVRAALAARFREVHLAADEPRPFAAAEYDALRPGLAAYFLGLGAAGRAELAATAPGTYEFRTFIYRAAGAREG